MTAAHESERTGRWEVAALFGVLIVYPLWSFLPFPWGEWIAEIYRGDRSGWWMFWLAVVLSHLPPFALVWVAIAKQGGWTSIGLDWGWFARRRWLWGFLAIFVAVSAWYAPVWLYPDGPPSRAESMWLVPVLGWERVFTVLAAITAGVTEEVMYRGFAISRLVRWVRSGWLAAILSSIAFAPIHATDSYAAWAMYIAVGLAFAIPFLRMKMCRLEYLIVAHILIDLGIPFAP